MSRDRLQCRKNLIQQTTKFNTVDCAERALSKWACEQICCDVWEV